MKKEITRNVTSESGLSKTSLAQLNGKSMRAFSVFYFGNKIISSFRQIFYHIIYFTFLKIRNFCTINSVTLRVAKLNATIQISLSYSQIIPYWQCSRWLNSTGNSLAQNSGGQFALSRRNFRTIGMKLLCASGIGENTACSLQAGCPGEDK